MFSSFRARLPKTEDEYVSFRTGALPRPPETMQTDQVVIERGFHHYNSALRRDRIFVHAHKETYSNLGLLVASVLFAQPHVTVTLHLRNPASDVRQLLIRRILTDDDAPGYQVTPLALNYYPEAVSKHPWDEAYVRPVEMPAFLLTNAAEHVVSETDWMTRDVVIGFGRDSAFAHLAELLLNIGSSASAISEVALEGEGGFRGVAPFSAECTLLLPGGFGFGAKASGERVALRAEDGMERREG